MPSPSSNNRTEQLLRLLVFGLLLNVSAPAEAESYAVIYPDVGSAYRPVFKEIIAGIHDRLDAGEIAELALLDEAGTTTTLAKWLDARTPRVVITLGRVATQVYGAAEYAAPQIIGGLTISPQTRPNATGISLSPDPELLFATLGTLSPDIERVFTVYRPQHDEWLIERARDAAPRFGLELIARQAASRAESARALLEILRQAEAGDDGIWLPLDDTLVDASDVLPFVVEQSWVKRLVVFSSNFAHTRSGVLFSLYPDTRQLGRQLAGLAATAAQTPSTNASIVPLSYVKRALNARVARHLDLNLDNTTRQHFELILRE